jgi:hypothetical protein
MIGFVLLSLGKTYEKSDQENKALVCYEDSMLMLDGLVNEVKGEDGYKIVNLSDIPGATIECKVPFTFFASSLGESYRRAGRAYLSREMIKDAAIAFE